MVRKAVSLRVSDALTGGGFQAGTTTIHTLRFQAGYHEHQRPEVLTLRLEHTPAATGEVESTYLSCGKSAAQNFKVAKKGTHLIPTGEVEAPQLSCNMMQFFGSLEEHGMPAGTCEGGHVDVLDGITVTCRQKPSEFGGGGGLSAGTDGVPRTHLVVTAIVIAPWGEEKSEEDEEGEDEEEEGDRPATAKPAADDGSTSSVDAHLLDILTASGGTLKRHQLPGKGYSRLKTVAGRNAIMTEMVELGFLARENGWTFDKESGQIRIAS